MSLTTAGCVNQNEYLVAPTSLTLGTRMVTKTDGGGTACGYHVYVSNLNGASTIGFSFYYSSRSSFGDCITGTDFNPSGTWTATPNSAYPYAATVTVPDGSSCNHTMFDDYYIE